MTPKQTQRLEALAYQYVVEQDHRSCRENHGCCQDDIRDEDLFKAGALAWQKELAKPVPHFENKKAADEVIAKYPLPNSLIDNGNLFFAATEYQKAYEQTSATVAALKAGLESYKIFPISPCDEVRLHADCWGKIQDLEDEVAKLKGLKNE